MPRYKLLIEYNGTPYAGWQRQKNLPSIQETLEEALAKVTHLPSCFYAAGRTDAGVHAIGQVAHVDIEKEFEPFKLFSALNHHLKGHRIAVLKAEIVDQEFHARFSAKKRSYIYKIINRRPLLALEEERAWHVVHPLDVEKMQMAANYLLGTHDFTSFRASNCQAQSAIRTLDVFQFKTDNLPNGQGVLIEAYIEGRSFLHHQVRNMMGSLKLIGQGKWSPSYIAEILKAKDRRSAGETAPASGLYFFKVEY